ncbi:ISAzo13 family transposase [Nocardia sp. IBHARD005]|uniref:ISAzo13 family transposase n=1 Tax=Nocardia sp. IBHARD005 TaxID=3457765 RepID=UPI0040598D0B
MGDFVVTVDDLAFKYEVLFPHLNERQRRLLLGADARMLGRGGGRLVASAAGVREATVSLGAKELESGEAPLERARRVGGGRKPATVVDEGLVAALLELVEPDMRGDPMSPLRWTIRSTRNLADELTARGHPAAADLVGNLLRALGFSLQANAKTLEGKQSPDRDAQFRYINEQVKARQAAGQPVISVDTKKKELIGQYKNAGETMRRKGHPVEVNDHDFPGDSGKVSPYGVYDMTNNTGWVNVGTDHDTAAFAVESVRRWWRGVGAAAYPGATELLVTADAGGSNGYRTRAWKTELARFAAETGLKVTVCHFPPGTSKWNTIEHRLFSHISMNWRGQPLTSHEVVVNSIAATTTRTGLRVHAELDQGEYPKGVKITDDQFAAVSITRHDWHGDWNYTIGPEPVRLIMADGDSAPQPTRPDTAWLRTPALTGLTPPQWDALINKLTVTRHAQRELHLHQRRGGTRQAAPGTGRKSVLTLEDRVAITLLHLRFATRQRALAVLFDVTQQSIHTTIQQTRPLLDLAAHTTGPTGITLADAQSVIQYHDTTTESE